MSFEIRLAVTSADLDAIFRLRHMVYAEEENLFARQMDRRISDRFDAFQETIHLMAFHKEQLVGSIRMIPTSEIGIPGEELFDDAELSHRHRHPVGRYPAGIGRSPHTL